MTPTGPEDALDAAPADHLPHIRRCYELAAQAVEQGNHPFGAVLVVDGRVVAEASNEAVTSGDPTRHAEMRALAIGLPGVSPADRARLVLYTSTEPCVMCTGAIYWSGIPLVVFGCSAQALAEAAGADFLVPSRQILAQGQRPTRVIGPLLEEEGRARHLRFWRSHPHG